MPRGELRDTRLITWSSRHISGSGRETSRRVGHSTVKVAIPPGAIVPVLDFTIGVSGLFALVRNAGFYSPNCKFGAIPEANFAEDLVHAVADRLLAQAQLVRDSLFVLPAAMRTRI